MSITTTPIPSTDTAKRALDKPCVVGRNLLEIAYGIAAANLVANTAGTLAGGDSSAAAPNGVSRLVDRFLHVPWKYGSSVATIYICIDQGATTLDTDTLIIPAGHNFSGASIKVEADSTTPSGDPWGTTLWSFTAGSSAEVRLQSTNMYQARYWRIKISGSASVWQVPEIFLGKSVQFLNKAENPFPPTIAARGNVIRKTTGGGVSYAYKVSALTGYRKLTWKVGGVYKNSPSSDPEKFLTNFYDFWSNSNAIDSGSKPFWYIEDPTSNPGGAKLVYAESPDLPITQDGPQQSILTLPFVEQGAG